jgi:hypothetical protein
LLGPIPTLETFLRRLPAVIRQLRFRQGERPPFVVEDERDLEDLLRSLLPLHFEDVRPESRTPGYAPGTRTDFVLASHRIALLAKHATVETGERHLARQLLEDVAYYERQKSCRTVVGFVYDPELLLRDPRQTETAWSKLHPDLQVRGVIAS